MDRLLSLTARGRGLPLWARYAAATLAVAVLLIVRLLTFGRAPELPFLLFFPAVVVAAMMFGRGAGIYTTFLSAITALGLIVEPARAARVPVPVDPSLALLAFVAVGLFTTFFLEAFHNILGRLADDGASLAAANRKLAAMAEDRAALLSEAVHRARNDLQRLGAMLQMQASAAAEPAARRALEEAVGRVAALARVNARLDRYRDDGRTEVDSARFLEGLVEDLRDGAVGLRPVALVATVEAHTLPLERALPIGMIVNELVGNALKYAFPGEREGRVEIGFRADGNTFVLTVADNGVGFDPSGPPRGGGLGTRLSRVFAGQLGGHLALSQSGAQGDGHGDGCGVVWTIRFPGDGEPR